MPEKIRFSIIGFGNIGLRHARQIEQNPNTELVAVNITDCNQFSIRVLLYLPCMAQANISKTNYRETYFFRHQCSKVKNDNGKFTVCGISFRNYCSMLLKNCLSQMHFKSLLS